MSAEFELAKSITNTYAEGMRQGAAQTLPAMERAHSLLLDSIGDFCGGHVRILEAKRVLEEEIRRVKGLPF